ncbi:hypothetical protein QBC45DRAFT_460048 [Copromyces sp. CBS 386.78]|nr:hypothetical protein QBC45DRAFT_460048 [Copromyces sp. CBS 386.78]
MSDNTSNNMANYFLGYIHIAPAAENSPKQWAEEPHQSSIPPTDLFDFNTPIDRSIQDKAMDVQPQDINMSSPPAYCSDPFNPIHYRHLAHIKTLEDVFGDYPVDFTTPWNMELASHPAVRNIFNRINTIVNLRSAVDAAAAKRNAKFCISHLKNHPSIEMEVEILRRKALGTGTCSTDFAWMPKETGKRCDRCAEVRDERARVRKEKRASAAAEEQSKADSSQSADDSVMSGLKNLSI